MLVSFFEESEVDAEACVGGFGASDGLEEEVERCSLLHGLHLRGEMGEDAGLDGDLVAAADVIDEMEERGESGYVIGDGVDADDGVAGAEEEAVEDGCCDACWVVGGMVGLEAGGEAAGQAYGGAEFCDDIYFAGYEDEVLKAHEFGDGGGYFGGEAGCEGRQGDRGGCVGEEMVAELAHGEAGDGGECGGGDGGAAGVLDETGDFVGFVWDDCFVEEVCEGEIGERHLGCDALLGGGGGDAGKLVTRAGGGGFGEEIGEGVEGVTDARYGMGVGHWVLR